MWSEHGVQCSVIHTTTTASTLNFFQKQNAEECENTQPCQLPTSTHVLSCVNLHSRDTVSLTWHLVLNLRWYSWWALEGGSCVPAFVQPVWWSERYSGRWTNSLQLPNEYHFIHQVASCTDFGCAMRYANSVVLLFLFWVALTALIWRSSISWVMLLSLSSSQCNSVLDWPPPTPCLFNTGENSNGYTNFWWSWWSASKDELVGFLCSKELQDGSSQMLAPIVKAAGMTCKKKMSISGVWPWCWQAPLSYFLHRSQKSWRSQKRIEQMKTWDC